MCVLAYSYFRAVAIAFLAQRFSVQNNCLEKKKPHSILQSDHFVGEQNAVLSFVGFESTAAQCIGDRGREQIRCITVSTMNATRKQVLNTSLILPLLRAMLVCAFDHSTIGTSILSVYFVCFVSFLFDVFLHLFRSTHGFKLAGLSIANQTDLSFRWVVCSRLFISSPNNNP